MEVSWAQVVVFAGTSGILSALVVHGLGLLDQRRKRGRDAGYLAIRIATSLEAFAHDCLVVLREFDVHRQSGGHAGSQTTSIPSLNDFPSDHEGWRALPTKLVGEVLSLQNHRMAGQDRIAFDWSVAGDDAAWDDCKEECAKLGLKAWQIAAELRKRYGFPELGHRFDIGDALQAQAT